MTDRWLSVEEITELQKVEADDWVKADGARDSNDVRRVQNDG